jgi:polyhydroxyalkanoate synthase
MARILAEVASRSSTMLTEFLQRHPTENGVTFKDELGIAKAYMDLWSRMLANPYQLAQGRWR